ncbi:hypothetical protein OEZ86_009631 [Tetradesmus obliquus]|uniref:Uncharacterized protein n=1 Tax=Tetradesmus obliquus TaxID=3088 RepID=A0ABY8UMH1_TETOB|nr:hypothetical protein OEZ85_001074 [Tetradesmus obliquus]WIA43112.1 hypothetical protein OEZ86_009631 [Tetradesmus obliquus]
MRCDVSCMLQFSTAATTLQISSSTPSTTSGVPGNHQQQQQQQQQQRQQQYSSTAVSDECTQSAPSWQAAARKEVCISTKDNCQLHYRRCLNYDDICSALGCRGPPTTPAALNTITTRADITWGGCKFVRRQPVHCFSL